MSGRIRTIKPEWLEDELLAGASDEARVLSVALILMSDDHGRGRASIAAIAAGAWRHQMERDDGAHAPETLAKASRALRELVAIGFVRLYEVSRQRYFELPNWSKHQRVDKPGKPRVPPPSECLDGVSRVSRESLESHSGESRETLAPDQDRDLEQERERGTSRERVSEAKPRTIPLDERVSHSDAQDTFGRLRVAHGGGPFRASMREHTRVSELADFANAQGATRDERMAALETTIRGYLARADEWATTRGWPISGMQDFGVCLAAGRKLSPPLSPQDAAVLTPLERLRRERESLIRLHGTGRFAALPQAERIASIERRDAVELALASMESQS
jgi:hypothetical protein